MSEAALSLSHFGRTKTGVGFLLLAAALYAAVQAAFFPSYYSQADEGCNVAMAHMFAHGRLSAEGLDLNLYRFTKVGDRLVGALDPGMGLLLAPFTFLGPRGVFAFNILMHLAGLVVFWALLRRLNLPPAFCLLYLLHPTLWYHSRNVLNDLASGVLCLTAVYFLLAGGRALLLAGLFFGLSLFVRPASAVFEGPFLLAWLVGETTASTDGTALADRLRAGGKKVGLLALGMFPVIAVMLLYNVFVLNNITGASDRVLKEGMWSLSHVPVNLLRYVPSMSVLYPLMLLLVFFYRGPLRWPIIASVSVGGVFYATFFDWGISGINDRYRLLDAMILGPRYFEPVLPLMILTYAWWLSRLAGRFPGTFRVVFAAGCGLLFAGDAVMTFVHQRHMDQAAYFRDQLFGNTPNGALVLMDEVVRTRISGDVTHPRRLMSVFPLGADGAARDRLETLLAESGEAYVPELSVGGEVAATMRTREDRRAFIEGHPHETVLDARRGEWWLRITRVRSGVAGGSDDAAGKEQP